MGALFVALLPTVLNDLPAFAQLAGDSKIQRLMTEGAI